MTCEKCGQVYLAGVVGRTPWPAHKCGVKTGSEVYIGVPKEPKRDR